MLVALGFVLMAVALVLMTHWGVKRGSLACGDGPGVAAGLARRFDVWAIVWVGVVLGASVAGVFHQWHWRPPAFPFLAGTMTLLGIALARSTFGDRLARGIPLAYLVAFQAFRFPLELLLHRAYTAGMMPIQMSYSGRNFDIVTGVSALVLGVVMMRVDVPKFVVWSWNVMGLALLVNIVTIAILSLPLFHYFGPDQLNTFVAYPPYVLLPAVMVLAAWAGHLVVFRALLPRQKA